MLPDSDDDKTLALGSGVAPRPKTASATQIGQSNDALPIGTQLSEFEIVDLVGQGGFGIVYLAADHLLERRVAIKEYMPSSLATRGDDMTVVIRSERRETFDVGRRSFVNEARLLAHFDHPALVKVFRFWEANGTAYMAMPYYCGRTLREVLQKRSEPPDESWIRKILLPIMEALELIHNEDCFHRDIAPDNIMVLKDGRPVLLDFGAARRVISGMTQALTVILKPDFAPIEQYADIPGARQGPWTDIYALAAVVYFMIMGQVPPPSVHRVMKDQYQPLTEVAAGRYSDQFLRAIDRCLAVRSEERPQSIAEMTELLGPDPTASNSVTRAASEETTILPAPRPPQPLPEVPSTTQPRAAASSPTVAGPDKWWRVHNVQVVGAIAALGVLTMIAYFLTGGDSVTTPAPPMAPVALAPSPGGQATSTPAADKPSTASPARPQISLGDAFAIALERSDASFGLRVDVPSAPLVVGRDVLTFTLSSKRSGYLYVLLWDKATDRLNEIFPNERDRDNQVAPGRPIRFPRPTWGYEADQPIGNWDILAIVSESQRSFPYFDGVGATESSGVAILTLERQLRESPQGGTPLTGEVICDPGRECSAAYAAARFVVTEVERETLDIASRRKENVDQRASPKERPGKSSAQGLDDVLDKMLKAH